MKVVDTSGVGELLDGGAQLVEVLPPAEWQREHLPGARNIPLAELRKGAVTDLDPAAPTIVYCYDHECDLSARGAAALEALGFSEVYDYANSKTAWFRAGLPAEGDVPVSDRAGGRATRAPTCRAGDTIGDVADQLRAAGTTVVVVVNADDVVLGALHPEAADLPPFTPVLRAANPGPATVRPSITRFELAKSMDDDGQHHVLVTTPHGMLIGLVSRVDLD